MKQVLLLIAIAAVTSVAVVGLTKNANSKKVDATELAQFEAWKEAKAAEALQATQASYVAPKATTTRRTTTKRQTSYQNPKMVSESQNAAKTTQKKGWSKEAKVTAIGAVGTSAVCNGYESTFCMGGAG